MMALATALVANDLYLSFIHHPFIVKNKSAKSTTLKACHATLVALGMVLGASYGFLPLQPSVSLSAKL